MISFEESLSIVRTHQWQPQPERVALTRSYGRRLAETVFAELDAPPYTSSAMDGYGVGSLEGPWQITGSAPAGSIGPAIGPQQAVQINTGSLIPPGTIAVIPREETEVQGQKLRANPVCLGAHIRVQGEEYKAGSPLFSVGTRITPPIMSAIAAQGIECVSVASMPRVALLSTGAELLSPGEPYIEGRVYNSNSIGIAQILEQMGCTVTRMSVIDNAESTSSAVGQLLPDHDLLITIGGVSVGDFDFVRPSVTENGFEIHFSGVSIKPGKPVAFGLRGDGKAWFGLPGNPMSALVTSCLFVLDYLGEAMTFYPVALQSELSRKAGREEFIPAQFSLKTRRLVLNPTVGSHATSGLAFATGLGRIPGELSTLRSGDLVEYAVFPWSEQS